MVRNYTRGFFVEDKVKKVLIDLGYHSERGHGSKGTFDVFGYRSDQILLIQCKRSKVKVKSIESIYNKYNNKHNDFELSKIYSIQTPKCAKKILCLYTDRQPGERKANIQYFIIHKDYLEEIEIEESI